MTSFIPRFALIPAVLFALSTTPMAQAGSGTYKNGVYNFCVSVRFNATPAQLTNIQTAFTAANQEFTDALDGKQTWGTISIANNSGCSDSAEAWVLSGTGRAFATYGKYGIRGQHAVLYYLGQTNGGVADGDFSAPTGGGVAYTVAHEMSHHSFGLADEYSGPGAGGAGHCAKPPDAASLNYCLMDNYFTRGGRSAGGTTYTLKEYCVKSDHDPDNTTYQTSMNHQSCWETIAAHPKRAATAPAGLPNAAAPSATAPTFRTSVSGLRVVIVIDHSGSMADDNKLDFAKQAAALFVGALKVGDSVAVVAFDDSVTVSYPFTQITGPSTLAAATSAINNIQLGGSTDIGDALTTALSQITTANPRGCNEVIVLLTDGDYNVGPDPHTVAGTVADQGVPILSVGLGSAISSGGQEVLQYIASQTGGKYFGLTSAFNLLGLFFQVSAEATGDGLLTRSPLTLAPNVSQDVPIMVEQGSTSVTFGVSLSNPNANVSISLKTPNNTIYSSDGAVTGAGGTVNRSNPNLTLYTFPNPATGTWHLTALSGVTTNIEVLASSVNNSVKLMVGTDKQSVQAPAPITIDATPQFNGLDIVGASISGLVTRPDGSVVPITLADNGDANSGDGVPNDGIYAARFNTFNTNGTYTVQLTATNTSGAYTQGELFGSAAGASVPAPQFLRTSSASFLVTGIDPCALAPTPLTVNTPVNGVISNVLCANSLNGSYTGRYSFAGTAGQQISISLSSDQVDTYLYLLSPTGTNIAEDDDSGGGTNSRIPSTGFFTLPSTGTYQILATTYFAGDAGPYTLVVNSPSTMALNRTVLNFGTNATLVTTPQQVTLTFTGASGAPWTATSNKANISVTPASGSGNAVLRITATAGSSGTVTVTSPSSTNSPQQITVNVGSVTPAAPYGSFDTPANNTTGVIGAIAVTGWALDNIEVTKVDIWREKIGAEAVSANGLVYIGDAVFVADARPDVQANQPSAPYNYRAGWGYLMLTNQLPNNGGSPGIGNGVYKLHAIAHNAAGASLDLGTRTITADNAHAVRPFGSIDTPNQGGTASATLTNFGWAVTQNPYAIPTDGSTITVTVDNLPIGHPVYNQNRIDIATLFPGLANSNGAVGYFFIDTTKLANGTHTIAWLVYDNQNRGEGIGSRFFNVFNNGTGPVAALDDEIPAALKEGVTLRRGSQNGREAELLHRGPDGAFTLELEELDRVELGVGAKSGHLVLPNGESRPLPAGSALKGGVFYWQLAPVFLGTYNMTFERPDDTEVRVRVTVHPKNYGSALQ